MGVEAVVLAAGRSSRAGAFKPTLTLGGKTLIEKCIEPLYDLCSHIVVVVGHRIAEIDPVLLPYSKVQLVFNPDYEGEMFYSVKVGVSYVMEERFFIVPADYPLIERTTYKKLLADEGDIIVPTIGGRTGHPVLLKSHLIPDLLDRNGGHSTLKDYINRVEPVRIAVDDPGIRFDIDTMNDYRRALELFEAKREACYD